MADALIDTDKIQYWWMAMVLVFMVITPLLVSWSNKLEKKRDLENQPADDSTEKQKESLNEQDKTD